MVVTFHSGGRIGDTLYMMYAMKSLVASEACRPASKRGAKLYFSLYHSPGWNKDFIDALKPLIMYQDYMHSVEMCEPPPSPDREWPPAKLEDGKQVPWQRYEIMGLEKPVHYDFQSVEDMFNPEDYPSWNDQQFPGSIHIAERYAAPFGVRWDPETVWLKAPKTKDEIDVVFHMPHRRSLRSPQEWNSLFDLITHSYGNNLTILGGPEDIHEWKDICTNCDVKFVVPETFLETADIINSSAVFLGGASSCNVIAEGLKKPRMVELRPDCFNTYPRGRTGVTINDWDIACIANIISKYVKRYNSNKDS